MNLLQQQTEVRQALTEIICELKQPLSIWWHQVRQLPKEGYYIFLPWEAYRERLNAVVPDHEIRFHDLTINIELNVAVLYCEIKILGVAKSEIGAVSISELSGSGNEMTRGNSVDRVHAEAFKNACEAWGIGAYISDQYYTYKLVERQKHLVSSATRDQLNRVQVFLQSQEKSGKLKSVAKIKAANNLDTGLPAPKEDKKEDVGAVVFKATAPSVGLRETSGLYPQHEALIKEFSKEFFFDTIADFIQKAIAKSCPGKVSVVELESDQLITLLAQVAAAWAHAKGLFDSRQNALNVIKGKIEFLKASSGGTIPVGAARQLCLEWHQSLLFSPKE